MSASEWPQLVDHKVVELRIGERAIELAFGDSTLRLEGVWDLLGANELKLDAGEGGPQGRMTYLHRLVGDKAVAWRFATQNTVALLFTSGLSLVFAKDGAEIRQVD